MATADAIRRQFDRSHGILTTAVVIVLTALGGVWATWLVGDFPLRQPAFVLTAAVLATVLYGAHDGRDLAARALYAAAGFLALTPVMLNLTYLFMGGYAGVTNPWAFVTTATDLTVLLVFLVAAAVPFAVGYYLRNAARVRGSVSAAVGRITGR